MTLPRSSRPVSRPILAALVLTPTLVVGGAAVAGGDVEVEIEPGTVDHGGRTFDVERGTLTVPMNRRDPASGTIRLRFVRYRSVAETLGPPVVFLAGGPGGSGIATMGSLRSRAFLAVLPRHDFIAFDQRGTGFSEPASVRFEGGGALPMDEPGDPETYCAIARETALHMLETMKTRGVDVRGLTTEESADDLAALRTALGVDRLVLWGSSYGTHLALATARRHPDVVAGLILAGTEGPDHTFKLPANIQANLEALAAIVRADPVYAECMPDLVGTVNQVLADLEREPRTVTLLPGVSVTVGKWDLQKALSGPMGSRGDLQQLPARVYAMSHGEFFDLARWAVGFRRPHVRSAMAIVMDCASYGTAERLQQIATQAAATPLGATIDFPFPCLCEVPGMPRLGDDFRAPLRSEIPALFISGTMDGRTPVGNAAEIAMGFPNAQHLVIEGASHGGDLFVSSPEIGRAVQAFLRGERIPATRVAGPAWALAPPFERSLPHAMLQVLAEDGYEAAVARYRRIRDEHAGQGVYDFAETVLNDFGYELLGAGMLDLAVDVFRLNTVAYPAAYNAWDSLGEGFLRRGDVAEAVASYEKSLELNPQNANAQRMLESIGGG